MRGRTNIPPRIGGIVNGVVREYQVSEEAGIEMGDYVQIGLQNSAYQTVLPYSSGGYNYTVKAHNDQMVSSYSNRLFTLSNGLKAGFYVANNNGNAPITVVLYSMSEDTLTFTTQAIEVPKSGYENYRGIVELSTDKFLFIAPGSNVNFTGYYILEYTASTSSWSYKELSLETSLSSKPTSCTEFFKISETLFGWWISQVLWIMKLDESSNTLTAISSSTVLSSSIYQKTLGLYNGYIVAFAGTQFYTISVDTNGTISLVSTSTESISDNNMAICIRLSNTKFLHVYVGETKDKNQISLWFNARTVDIGGTGQISINDATGSTQIISRSNNYISYNYQYFLGMGYNNGVLFGEIIETGASSSSATSYPSRYIGLFSIPIEPSSSDVVSIGDIAVLPISTTYSYTSSTQLKVSAWNEPVQISNNIYLFGGSCGYIAAQRMYIVKPTKNGLSNLFSADLIKKYSTKVSGIAKTSGSNGSIIEVYMPE